MARADAHRVPLATILTSATVLVAIYAAAKILYRLRDLLLMLLVSGFVAFVLNPVVNKVERVVLRRATAVAIVVFVAALGFTGLAVLFGYPLVNGLTHLANNLPSYIHNAQQGHGWLGTILRRYHVEHWISANTGKLVTFAKGLSKPALALGKGAFSMLLVLFTMLVLVILLLVEAPQMRARWTARMNPARHEVWSRVYAEISKAAVGFVIGGFVLSLIAAVVMFVTLTILGVPFALLWSLWVLLVNFLPQIGGALAGIPVVAFAFVQSPTAGVVTLIVFVVYTLVQNHVLYPIVMSRAVKVNSLAVFLAILIGANMGSWVDGVFGGFVGVMLAIPFAAALQVLVRTFWDEPAS